jgi:hypothetical protein
MRVSEGKSVRGFGGSGVRGCEEGLSASVGIERFEDLKSWREARMIQGVRVFESSGVRLFPEQQEKRRAL